MIFKIILVKVLIAIKIPTKGKERNKKTKSTIRKTKNIEKSRKKRKI